eukprot:6540850-Prymnesium_polylepis.1
MVLYARVHRVELELAARAPRGALPLHDRLDPRGDRVVHCGREVADRAADGDAVGNDIVHLRSRPSEPPQVRARPQRILPALTRSALGATGSGTAAPCGGAPAPAAVLLTRRCVRRCVEALRASRRRPNKIPRGRTLPLARRCGRRLRIAAHLAAVNHRAREHRLLLARHRAAHDRLQRHHHVARDQDRVDCQVRLRTVAALAVDHDLKLGGVCHHGAGAHVQLAEREGRPVVVAVDLRGRGLAFGVRVSGSWVRVGVLGVSGCGRGGRGLLVATPRSTLSG